MCIRDSLFAEVFLKSLSAPEGVGSSSQFGVVSKLSQHSSCHQIINRDVEENWAEDGALWNPLVIGCSLTSPHLPQPSVPDLGVSCSSRLFSCAGHLVQKDTVRGSIESFAEFQRDYINWLSLITSVGSPVVEGSQD